MGFFGSLFRGTKGFSTATNALLAEATLPKLDASQRNRIKSKVLQVLKSGGMARHSDEYLSSFFDRQPRLVQLNFVAIACQELNIKPAIDGEIWCDVKNPFLPNAYDDSDILAVRDRLRTQRRAEISVKAGQLSLSEF